MQLADNNKSKKRPLPLIKLATTCPMLTSSVRRHCVPGLQPLSTVVCSNPFRQIPYRRESIIIIIICSQTYMPTVSNGRWRASMRRRIVSGRRPKVVMRSMRIAQRGVHWLIHEACSSDDRNFGVRRQLWPTRCPSHRECIFRYTRIWQLYDLGCLV